MHDVMRLSIVLTLLFHAHLMSHHVCPDSPGAEQLEVSARSSAMISLLKVGSALVGHG